MPDGCRDVDRAERVAMRRLMDRQGVLSEDRSSLLRGGCEVGVLVLVRAGVGGVIAGDVAECVEGFHPRRSDLVGLLAEPHAASASRMSAGSDRRLHSSP